MIFTPFLILVCCQGDRLLPSLLLTAPLSISGLELFIFWVLFPVLLPTFAVEFEMFKLDADRVRIILALGYCSLLYNTMSPFSRSNVLF